MADRPQRSLRKLDAHRRPMAHDGHVTARRKGLRLTDSRIHRLARLVPRDRPSCEARHVSSPWLAQGQGLLCVYGEPGRDGEVGGRERGRQGSAKTASVCERTSSLPHPIFRLPAWGHRPLLRPSLRQRPEVTGMSSLAEPSRSGQAWPMICPDGESCVRVHAALNCRRPPRRPAGPIAGVPALVALIPPPSCPTSWPSSSLRQHLERNRGFAHAGLETAILKTPRD